MLYNTSKNNYITQYGSYLSYFLGTGYQQLTVHPDVFRDSDLEGLILSRML